MFGRSSSAQPAAAGSGADDQPPGLGEQFGRTKGALFGLVGAHMKLARAEFSEIGQRLKHVAMLAGIAFALLFLAGMTVVVGLALWLGDWLLGSIGWGALDGCLVLVVIAAFLLLAIVEFGWGRIFAALLVGIAAGVLAALIVGLPWQQIGDQSFSGIHLGFRPLLLSLVWGAAVAAVVFGLLGAWAGRVRGLSFGILLGAFLGALLGLLAAARPDVKCTVAIGLTIGLLVWPIWAAVLVLRGGVDWDKVKARFMPTVTIETTKETIEWVRKQMPLAPKS